MAKTYLVTCGTSAYENYFRRSETRREDQPRDEEALRRLLCEFYANLEQPLVVASAEASTLYRLQLDRSDTVILFGSNARESRVSLKVVEELLLGMCMVETRLVEGLNPDKNLTVGLGNLARMLAAECTKARDLGASVEFIVTGGYKAMTAVGSAVAMLMECPAWYMFEGTTVPQQIGVLPIAVRKSKELGAIIGMLDMEGKFSHSELKSRDITDGQIAAYFTRGDDRLFSLSPLAALFTKGDIVLPTCEPMVPIITSEASKSHSYPGWGKIACWTDIPDRRARRLLEGLARSLFGEAEAISLGEFKPVCDEYALRYAGASDGVVRFYLCCPGLKVTLSAKPAGKIEALDELCSSLWRA